MITQRTGIIRVLTENGWRVIENQDSSLDWWADEIITLESTWSPQGQRLYLTFLVDPQHDGDRRKGEAVWAVAISPKKLLDRHAEENLVLSLGRGWQERLGAFVEQANRLRQ